jgi:hypothetical protein
VLAGKLKKKESCRVLELALCCKHTDEGNRGLPGRDGKKNCCMKIGGTGFMTWKSQVVNEGKENWTSAGAVHRVGVRPTLS